MIKRQSCAGVVVIMFGEWWSSRVQRADVVLSFGRTRFVREAGRVV